MFASIKEIASVALEIEKLLNSPAPLTIRDYTVAFGVTDDYAASLLRQTKMFLLVVFSASQGSVPCEMVASHAVDNMWQFFRINQNEYNLFCRFFTATIRRKQAFRGINENYAATRQLIHEHFDSAYDDGFWPEDDPAPYYAYI